MIYVGLATLAALFASVSAQSVVPIVASTSTSIPFPTATLANSDATNYMQANWGLSKGKIQNGVPNFDFVSDPFPKNPAPGVSSSTSGPVMRVQYAAGSFSNDNNGGGQFYSLWNSSTPFQSMMLSYEVAFGSGYTWEKGGKLPGLRGGAPDGCAGGNQADGSACFSSRVMWRTNGAGEIYAYIPRDNGLCKSSDVLCNDEFGASMGRGNFNFASGQWNKVTMAIWLNSPVNIANGRAQLYFNDQLVIDHSTLVFRTSENLTANGLYFSTFFGGSDPTWAPTSDQTTYFRNMQLFGGPNPSNLTGPKVSGAGTTAGRVGAAGSAWIYLLCAVVGAFVL